MSEIDGGTPRPRGRPGPKPVQVPDFSARLDAILAALGRNQGWLAAQIGRSSQVVSGYRRSGTVPRDRVAAIAALAGIPLAALLDPDPARFEAELPGIAARGRGARWAELLARCATSGLSLEPADGQANSETGRLSGLSLRPPDVARPVDPPVLAEGSAVRLRWRRAEPSLLTRLVLVCDDGSGRTILHPRPGTAPALDAGDLVIPGPADPALFVTRPFGPQIAVALRTSEAGTRALSAVPARGPRAVAALDAWLACNPVHDARKQVFVVTPAAKS